MSSNKKISDYIFTKRRILKWAKVLIEVDVLKLLFKPVPMSVSALALAGRQGQDIASNVMTNGNFSIAHSNFHSAIVADDCYNCPGDYSHR